MNGKNWKNICWKNEVDDNDKPSLKSAIVNSCCVGFVFLVVFVVGFVFLVVFVVEF